MEKFGAGSGTEGVEAFTELLLKVVQVHERTLALVCVRAVAWRGRPPRGSLGRS